MAGRKRTGWVSLGGHWKTRSYSSAFDGMFSVTNVNIPAPPGIASSWNFKNASPYWSVAECYSVSA